MNKRLDELLAQLKQLSPMPDDQSITQEQIDAYAEVIDQLYYALREDNDPRAIQPLIDSFGYIDGFGVYQTTLTILGRFSDNQLMPHLLESVQHGERGSRAWSALMLGHTEDRAVVPYLLPLLNDPEEYVRGNAAIALGNIGDPSTLQAIEKLKDDPSLEVREATDSALEAFGVKSTASE